MEWHEFRNGNIKSLTNRMNEDPAPVVYAHGIAWVVVSRDSVVLSGRQHAAQMATLALKSDRNVKNTASAFIVGLIATPTSFLRIQTFHRQLEQHADPASVMDQRFPKEGSVTACDTMTSDHTDLCYIAKLDPRAMRIFDVPSYDLFCGPRLKVEVDRSILTKGKIRQLKDLRQIPYSNNNVAQPQVIQPTDQASHESA